ncbi:GGDEF domain-containing protein [Amycolatopsis sp. NPDC101161]|uniref:GGDEF domain-containing protein n=1 Tax=Amycolatopsis sp. NPDC101161 TaxID=3363940 RepID=UPI003802ABBB
MTAGLCPRHGSPPDSVPITLGRSATVRRAVLRSGLSTFRTGRAQNRRRSSGRATGRGGSNQAIQAVAGLVQAEVRSWDLVARWGGDELAVMGTDFGHQQLLDVAERIRSRLAGTPITLTATSDGKQHTLPGVTTPMGVAFFPWPADCPR